MEKVPVKNKNQDRLVTHLQKAFANKKRVKLDRLEDNSLCYQNSCQT